MIRSKRLLGKKFFGIALCSIISFSLVGCNSSSSSDSSSGKKDKDITIMAPTFSLENPTEESPTLTALEEYTGKDIQVTWVPNSSYEDKFNVTMASGDLPELMIVTGKSAGFISSAEKGAFWELSSYLKDYKNLSQADEQVLKNSSVNGEIYGIYRGRDKIRSVVIIRKDWLENLGLSMPTTIDEFYNVLKAFKEDDPDGNGQDDTYGMVIPKWSGLGNGSPFDVIQIWFGAPNKWGEDKDGNLIPDFTTSEFMDALKFMKKLYDEGLINKDFAVLDTADWNEPVVSGKAGIIIDTDSRARQIDTQIKEAYPNLGSVIDVVGTVSGPMGERTIPTSGYAGLIAIPKQSVKTEEQLKDVLSFLDKLNDKEAQILLNNGVEGRNFKIQDGKYVSLEADDKSLLYEHEALNQLAMSIPENLSYNAREDNELNRKLTEIATAGEEIAVYNPAESLISKTYTQKGVQLDNIILDARVKFISGQIDEKGFQDAVDLWFKSGGEDYVKEINKLYKNMDN